MSENFIKITGAIALAVVIISTTTTFSYHETGWLLFLAFIFGQVAVVIFWSGIITLIPLVMKKNNKATTFTVSCFIFTAIVITGQLTSNVNNTHNKHSEIKKGHHGSSISPSEANVSGKGRIDGNVFKGSIYNGSDKYRIVGIVITINHKDGTSRDYKTHNFYQKIYKLDSSINYFSRNDTTANTTSSHIVESSTINSLDSGSFIITTFDTTSNNFDFWYIKSVEVEM